MYSFESDSFGSDFIFGVSSSAAQTEGACNYDGKGASIWDTFSKIENKIADNHNLKTAADFYNRYVEDIAITRTLSIPHFRFSIAWSRLLPDGIGQVNEEGVDFYNRVIDCCLENGIEPWITLYHWDLPQALELRGGWTNREIVSWFSEYATLCVKRFKDRVKYWMILNEPTVFTGAGYFMGIHAPGKKGLSNFLPAVHHATLCQSIGAKIIKQESPTAEVGSTFSCSFITPYSLSAKDRSAAFKVDALLNRLFIEPALGMGYPYQEIPLLKKIEKYFASGDEELMKADFDFIGIQNYTREVVKHSYFVPYLQAQIVSAAHRKVYHTAMDWEVYPESIYEMIKKFSAYKNVSKIIVTENGAAFRDIVENDKVDDTERVEFLKNYLAEVAKAKAHGLKVNGYFVWSLTDNFEWAEGYNKRFGLVYIDFKTQKRVIKNSGWWYKNFINRTNQAAKNEFASMLLENSHE